MNGRIYSFFCRSSIGTMVSVIIHRLETGKAPHEPRMFTKILHACKCVLLQYPSAHGSLQTRIDVTDHPRTSWCDDFWPLRVAQVSSTDWKPPCYGAGKPLHSMARAWNCASQGKCGQVWFLYSRISAENHSLTSLLRVLLNPASHVWGHCTYSLQVSVRRDLQNFYKGRSGRGIFSVDMCRIAMLEWIYKVQVNSSAEHS